MIESILRSEHRPSGRVGVLRWMLALLTCAACIGLAGSTLAMDDIAVPGGVEGAAESGSADAVQCPQLTRMKYPFLTCSLDEGGQVVLDAMGAPVPGPRMPAQSPFMDSLEYWGN